MRTDANAIAGTASWVLICLAIAGVLLTSAHSVISFALFYALYLLGHLAVEKRLDLPVVNGVFAFYVLAVLGLYWTQYLALPSYYGFSGGLGVGTDDSFFYSVAAPEITEDLPLREKYFANNHPYGVLLRAFAQPMYAVYGAIHPIDMLLLNATGLAFLPFFVRNAARILTDDEGTARWAFTLSLLCPVLMANGGILIRDGLTATVFIGALYGLLSGRFLLMALMIGGAAFLRLPQAVLLVGSLCLISFIAWYRARPLAFTWRPSGTTVAAIAATPVVVGVLVIGVLGTDTLASLAGIGLFRDGFLHDFIQDQAASQAGPDTFYAINQMPLPLRLPLAFLFYFGAPYLALETFMGSGPVMPRHVLTALYGVLFIAYGGLFVRGALRAWNTMNAAMLGIVITYCVDLLLLSQASMQSRHKTALLPLLYIVVAYGIRYRQRDAVVVGLLCSLGIGTVVLLFNGYKIAH